MNIVEQSFQIIERESYINMVFNIEAAGRTCYKSEGKSTGKLEDAEKFVETIIKRGHLSVLEHANITARLITDRGVTHELVRHRIGVAYSQESTRYCNYGNKEGGVTFILPTWFTEKETGLAYATWHEGCLQSEYAYIRLLELGQTPQQARTVLNNSLKTEIVVTANIREWLHIFDLRCAAAAHPQMRALMKDGLLKMGTTYPVFFSDPMSKCLEG